MYRVAVCDDEPQFLSELCELCDEVLTKLNTAHEVVPFSSAEALLAAIAARPAPFHILLLDIQLGGKTGIELARELRNRGSEVSIVFITNDDQYWQDGYTLEAVQYLLKPVSKAILADTLRMDLKRNYRPKVLPLTIGTRTVVLPLSDILYLESYNHGTKLHMAQEDRVYPISLSAAAKLLPAGSFYRCHYSFIVNMEHISELTRAEVVLRGGERVPIGRKYYTDTQNALVDYITL